MKKAVSLIMIIISILIFSACSINNNFKKITNSTYTENEKGLLQFRENLLLDNKPILNTSYSDVIKNFGKPYEIRIEKILLPGSSPQDYSYEGILSYDGIDFEFELGSENSIKHIEKCSVLRFDITSNKYKIGDLKVGMSVREYEEKFTNSKIYAISDLATTDTDKLSAKDAYIHLSLKKLLITSKPKDYYSMYENVSYQQGVLLSKSGETIAPLGFALLIKNNKIDRIVYGFPNAS